MNTEKSNNYEDIINLPHHVSTRHPQMDALARAAQFSPFAALTGHDEAIRETGRMTEEFRTLDEDRKELLDNKIRLIQENLSRHPEVEVTYFQPDAKKSGGAYITVRGRVKKIDAYSCRMIFMDQTELSLENIYSISETIAPCQSKIPPNS